MTNGHFFEDPASGRTANPAGSKASADIAPYMRRSARFAGPWRTGQTLKTEFDERATEGEATARASADG